MRVQSFTDAAKGLRPSTAAKLFGVGLTVGPVVDSLHNQCLLRYEYAPINIPFPDFVLSSLPAVAAAGEDDGQWLLATSWAVPPLLGIAYVVLGGVLPKLFQWMINKSARNAQDADSTVGIGQEEPHTKQQNLQWRAIVAVLSTAAIIKLSELLEINPTLTDPFVPGVKDYANQHIFVLLVVALCQWAFLDGTAAALLAASITSIGGPLSELPFVAGGFWHYLPTAGDYLPLQGVETDSVAGGVLAALLGSDFQSLALSSITGPCYFAVTMDAIALGRWFDSQDD
ncbi:hypothetical protein ACA910_013296 [Epithemia clementina (nom. ined.)]